MKIVYNLLSQTPTPIPSIQVKGNEWALALILLSVLILFGLIIYFAVSAHKLKKANNGFPELIEREQEKK